MNRLVRKITVSAVAVGAAMSLGLATSGTASAASNYQGCPAGYVCLYPQNAGWNGGVPSYKWYTYGGHNISGQYGTHRFFNNQTGGAIARNCTGSNGTSCQGAQAANTYADYNYTPYNSVLLSAK